MTPTQTLKDESKPPPNPNSTPNLTPNSTPKTPNLTTPKTLILPNNSDQDIDIVNSPSNLGQMNTIKDEDLDKTECSSSFGDTLSGTCSEINHEMSDSEVESPFARLKEDVALSDFIPRLYKKKKVTSHWRKYISPLMYRCQWLELRIKEIQNQASKYEKELAFIKQEKEVHSRMIELDRSCSRIVPFTSKFRSKKAMKRKKRKRDEDSKDGLRYMEDHVVFSYYENKKPETDGHSLNDYCPDPVEETTKANEESEFILSPNCSDNFYIKVLIKIDSLQSRVQTLKSKLNSCTAKRLKRPSQLLINNVINGNNNNNNQSPCIIQVNGNNNHNDNNNDDNNIVNNNGVSEDDDVADGGLPGSAVSSFGDAADVAALEASSRCPFADVAHMQHLCKEEIMEDVLIDNQAIAGEQYRHPIEMRQVSFIKTEPSEESTAPISPISKEEHTSHSDQDLSLKPNQILNLKTNSGLFLKRCYTGKRRGRRPNKNFGISGSVSGNGSGNGSDVNKQGIKGKRSGMVMLASTSSGPWRSERVKKPKIRD